MYYSYDGLPLLAGSGTIDLLGHIGPEAVFQQIVRGLRKEPYLCVSPLNHGGETPKKSAWRFTNGISSWNWPGYEGIKTKAEVYTDAPKVRLYRNGTLLGERTVKNNRASFRVAYTPGELKAVAVYPNHEECTVLCSGSGECSLQAATVYTGSELSFIEISAVDKSGMLLPAVESEIIVECRDGVQLLGLGSACTKTNDSYVTNRTHLYRGQAMAIIRGKAKVLVAGSKIVINRK